MTRLTAKQRKVLETAGHLLVDAGAGSGKTTTVVQALCHHLGLPVETETGTVAPSANPLALDQVAAITFTNQSAADLKRKLRAALRAGGHRELANEVDAARIGTIHGFCGDLLRDFALRAKARPGRRTLTDAEAAMQRADVARAVLHAALEANDVAGLDALLTGRRLSHITEWLLSCADDSGRLARWAEQASVLRPHEQALLTLARRVNAAHTAQLDARGELDFDRMIVATRELLERPDVRRAVQRRVRLLVIDEFQDVDPVQRDIAEMLGDLAGNGDPAPTRLILVGDPKQSIYRFRRADVTVWNQMAARFDGVTGTVLPLNENFRSKAAILGFVDAVVGTRMREPVDPAHGRQPFEVEYAPLEPKATGNAGDHAVELLVAPADAKGKPMKVGEIRAREGAGIATRILALRAEGKRWRDIAILLASWGEVEIYADALREAGIPLYVQRGEGFYAAREVLDVLLALRVIRDPSDDVAMVGFLRSPFIGVRDDTLLALAQARGREPFARVLGDVTHERALLDRAVALLARFVPLRDRLPAHELLQRLLEESGYTAVAALSPEGGQRLANLRKLVRMAANLPELSLGEFLREIELTRDREEKVAQERLYAEGGDVVTITSIHGAKGLEWPVVIWADLSRGRNAATEKFLAGRDRFAVRADEEEGEEGEGDPVHAAVKQAESLEADAETLRLWYVAATRAKETLILSGLALGDAGKTVTPSVRILESLGGLAGKTEVAYVNANGATFHARVQTLGGEPADAGAAEATAPALALPPEPVRVPSGSTRLSATQLMSFARDPEQWHRTYVTRFDPALVGAGGETKGRAIIAGQVVHDVLEKIGDGELDLETLLEQAIARWDEDAPELQSDLGRQYRAFLRTRIDAAQRAPAWQAMVARPSARHELGFMRIRPDGTAITGAFDLAAIDGDAVRILDLKNSTASTDALAERYRVQAAVYVEAARAIAGAREGTFELLALPSSASVMVPPAEDLDGLIARLRASDGPSALRPPSARP